MMNGVAEAPNGENKTQIWCDSREPTGCRKARWPSSLLSQDKERVRIPSAVPNFALMVQLATTSVSYTENSSSNLDECSIDAQCFVVYSE